MKPMSLIYLAGALLLATLVVMLWTAVSREQMAAALHPAVPAPPMRPARPPADVAEIAPDTPVAVQPPPEEAPPEWERPRFGERRGERLAMVQAQIERRGVTDEAVLAAMRHVPRHLFVPRNQLRSAYADHPLPIGMGQTISQPYIVALMTQLLELEPGDKVLEIGTGSGYQAAVLSELTPHVYTIEILGKLADQARERFEALGYETIHVQHADGYYGWEEHAPFDAVIVTAAAGHIPPPLVAQLKPDGKMAIPVGGVFETQYLTVVRKDEEGGMRTRSVAAVRFVPMTGRAQQPR
jgi:protein-L-isoaspartate(D-aspartate) O-methyltransferase